MSEALLLPALMTLSLLLALRARVDVYGAFVRGAKEGLETVVSVAPYLCAILTATALFRETGLMDRLQASCAPLFGRLGIPKETMSVVLLRPLSGSAALGAVAQVMEMTGADSRASRIACMISGASETVFFTGALYLGAAGVKHARYAVPVSLMAYGVGVLTAALIA